ncbi:unnamed protein product [Phaedon cochleariae]|uniref:Uncharacterized protein n=1 Tax=Phaedon cochleariae TaxID=80249 RepID=A0A9P0DAC1_PHACE|nr:unnamed protein product [Phaedon cochleariae]
MKDKEYTAIDIESSMETQRLLDHDSLAQNYQEHQEMTILPRYTTNATLQISATPVDVDDPISLELDNAADKKPYDLDTLQTKVLHSKYSVYIPTYRSTEERKVDENGNALHQNPATKAKKKKTQTDKNVVVLTAERVEGHRSDIINDVDKLIQYIKGGDAGTVGKGGRSSNVHKSKQLHKQHASEDGPSSRKKQRANSTKGKESRPELKKSNSLGEISTATLDDFAFVGSSGSEKDSEGKVVLRHKSQGDRPKERRSWGNVEPPPFQILSSNASTENLETTDNWVVTKPKKKSKKRRNSVSSGRRPTSSSESNANRADRVPSPDLRSKSARSVPHSERSNDSSDADSVHSLPIDGLNAPISYADIAKNSEKAKEKKTTPEKPKEKSPSWDKSAAAGEKQQVSNPRTQLDASKSLPPDFNDAKSFPAIPIDSAKSPSSFPAIPADSVKSPASFPAIPVDSVKSPASFPAIPVDSVKSPASFPAIVSEGDSGNPKNLFPDVNSIRSFPAITNNSKGCVVEKTNVRNVSVSGKSRNVSPGNKSGGKAADGDVKFGGTNNAGAVNSSIQNDLTIIHSNEKDSIQFNAQMLPPNIPDVQTIEKMHFLNCPPPQQQRPPPPDPPATTPLTAHAAVSSLPAHTAASPAAAHTAASPVPAHTVSLSAGDLVDSETGSNCDSVERTIEDRPPPVVILSGQGSKEATVGLVFGFDVNEQLLKEDICENFVARYVAPPAFDSSALNHDKIVNFIGSAWEAIVNQSNGKVQYYKEKP